MKRILIAFLALAAFSTAKAQQNTLLEATFWQTSPTVDALKAEIAKGNNPAQLNGNSMDPVVTAINANAPTETVKYLIEQPGNDVNKLTHDGRIYLHWAASRGNVELVEYLLKKGSKLDLVDSHGSTPLLFSANQKNTKIFDVFVAHGANLQKDVNADGANILLLAIANDKDFTLTDYFISKGVNLNSTDAAGNNAFAYAARGGNIEFLKKLVEKGVKPNANAMLMAAQGGGGRGAAPAASAGTAIFEYLESVGIKPTAVAKNGENVLHAIARKPNQAEQIKYFLAKGVSVDQVNEDGNNVLMSAASTNRDLAVLELLLPKTKNINLANIQGQTALTLAVRANSPEVVSYLISKGADVKVLDKKGNNLAFYALESYRSAGGRGGMAMAGGPKPEDFETKLNTLKTAGLDITAPQKDGNTLYHLAVAKNDLSLVKRVQALGVDINAKNKEGITPLHKAALIAKDDAMMKYLLSIDAKKDAVTNFKETAFDLASENETLTKNKVALTFLK